MKENTFLRSFKLVPEVHRSFFFASMIAMVGTGVRMIGPQLISRGIDNGVMQYDYCLLYTSPSPRDGRISRMPSSA